MFLSQTYEGKIHDKAICDQENYHFPENTSLRVDLGYLAYNPINVTIIIPKKKQKKGELSQESKDTNKAKSKERVIAEHGNAGIKRLRSLTDRLKLKLFQYQDSLMVIGCALHNLRVRSPIRKYASRTGELTL
ncbi:transposase family protein [Emticicia agri]|uniref:transposase family protein n=1 Tax=Emticicia agri TaxID=2492393 RepID=UPI001E39F176|nr:transposase family protein [Emticicia agri]